MMRLIPVYSASGKLEERATEDRIRVLEGRGLLAKTVRHKKGYVNRAVLRWRSGDAGALARLPLGTKYSFLEKFEGGGRAWRLMPLSRLLLLRRWAAGNMTAKVQ